MVWGACVRSWLGGERKKDHHRLVAKKASRAWNKLPRGYAIADLKCFARASAEAAKSVSYFQFRCVGVSCESVWVNREAGYLNTADRWKAYVPFCFGEELVLKVKTGDAMVDGPLEENGRVPN